MEGHAQEVGQTVCYEGNAQGQSHHQEERPLGHERKEVFVLVVSSVSAFYSKVIDPFCRQIVNMNYAFEDRENLFLVIDLMTGGDLRYHLAKHKKFSEEQSRFFIACMLGALEYLH